MAEEGVVTQSGQPVMGKGAGSKAYMLPVCKDYETVAAGQTDQVLGATGAAGDYLEGVLIVPALVACGAVSIKDGGGSAITIFVGGGTTALADATPFFVPIKALSTSGAWKITTGASVSAIGVGSFT